MFSAEPAFSSFFHKYFPGTHGCSAKLFYGSDVMVRPLDLSKAQGPISRLVRYILPCISCDHRNSFRHYLIKHKQTVLYMVIQVIILSPFRLSPSHLDGRVLRASV